MIRKFLFITIIVWIISVGIMPTKAELKEPFFLIDFDRVVTIPTSLQNEIKSLFETNENLVESSHHSFVVTSKHEVGDWIHLVLVPKEIYASNWELPLLDEDIVEIIAYQNRGDFWDVYFKNQLASSLDDVKVTIPTALIDFGPQTEEAQESMAPYLFPWTRGHTWKKTRSPGWHGSNNDAIDFAPVGAASLNVLTVDAGFATKICDDGYQAMLRVNHGPVTTEYLHVDSGSIPGGVVNQSIGRFTILGSLYTGTAKVNPPPSCIPTTSYKFATACGCGTATHLHFETSDKGITIDGYNINTVANSVYGTQYLSSNGPDPDSTPPTSNHTLSGTVGNNGWYKSNVTVNLTATDNAGGSGVKNIQYKAGVWRK